MSSLDKEKLIKSPLDGRMVLPRDANREMAKLIADGAPPMERLFSTRIAGHETLEYIETGALFYAQNGKQFSLTARPCALCGHSPTLKGHDACISDLPGVNNACCGHGVVEDAYVVLKNGKVLKRQQALDYLQAENLQTISQKKTFENL